MANDTKEFTVPITGGEVPVISFGKGEKIMVMIPGLRLSDIKGSARTAARFYSLFARDYRVYMIDRKDRIAEGCTIHDLAEDTYEVMKKLRLKDVYLFGVSQGGMISQDIAIHHPDMVKKMALGVTLSRNNDTTREVLRIWKQLAEKDGLGAVAADYFSRAYSESYLKRYGKVVPLVLKTQRLMPVDRFLILSSSCLTCNTWEDLDRIRCPVLVLGGGKDRIVTGEASLEIAEKLNCPCFLYEDLSHEAYNEAKDFNQRIYDFFEAE